LNTLWLQYARILDLKERALRRVLPGRMRIYPHNWPLALDVCACDVDFCDYLRDRGVRERSIFHFGTGGHHLVGLRNHADRNRNDILGITASPPEHARYRRLLARDASLGAHYKVLFADIYDLGPALPRFDYVSLFHLCEYSPRAGERCRVDDRGLLALMISRLAPGGRILFYAGSGGRRATAALIDEALAAGRLVHVEDFRSLRIFEGMA